MKKFPLLSRLKYGFAVNDVGLSLAAVSVFMFGITDQVADFSYEKKLLQVGSQIVIVDNAIDQYVRDRSEILETSLQAGPSNISIQDLKNANLLPASFDTTTMMGQTFGMAVRRTGPFQFEYYTFLYGGQRFSDEDLSTIVQQLGAYGGAVYSADDDNFKARGGLLVEPISNFAAVTAPSVGYPAMFNNFFKQAVSTDYLGKTAISGVPERNTMQTDLLMGGNDLTDVADLSLTGTFTIDKGNGRLFFNSLAGPSSRYNDIRLYSGTFSDDSRARLIFGHSGAEAASIYSTWTGGKPVGFYVRSQGDHPINLMHNSVTKLYTKNEGIGVNGELSATGSLVAGSEVISTSANAFRMVQGSYGAFFRNDGANIYLLFTNSNNQYGNWSSLRPMSFALSNGYMALGMSTKFEQLSLNGNLYQSWKNTHASNLYNDGGTWRYGGNGYGGIVELSNTQGDWTYWSAPNNTAGAGAAATITRELRYDTSAKTLEVNGYVTSPNAPVNANHLTRKDYVDNAIAAAAGGEAPCTNKPVGTVCSDGSVFIGRNPRTGKKLFFDPNFSIATRTWSLASSVLTNYFTDYVTNTQPCNIYYTEASFRNDCHDGSVLTESLGVISGTSPYATCRSYTGLGYEDWYVPSLTEMNLLSSADPAVTSYQFQKTDDFWLASFWGVFEGEFKFEFWQDGKTARYGIDPGVGYTAKTICIRSE